MKIQLPISFLLVLFLMSDSANCQVTIESNGKNTNLLNFSNIEEAWEMSKGDGARIAIMDWSFDLKGKEKKKYVDQISVVEGEKIGDMKPWHGEWMAETAHQVAPNAKIIPIRTRSLKTRTYQEMVAKAIHYAADHGAIVVTSSMGPLKYSDEIKKAIDYAESHGMVFVDVHPELILQDDDSYKPCKGNNCDPRIIHAGIVSVATHPVKPDPDRQVYVWPYDLQTVYKDGWGFSNAPPIIAGVIALMKSANPSLTPADIRKIIKASSDQKEGFNVLNAVKAVKASIKLAE